ncbi:hypothetical protein GOODEAATRI_033534, partial [Goodea atripinnis]
ESMWLKNIFTFIHQHLSPAACGSAHSAADQSPAGASCDHSVYELSVCVVEKIQEKSCLSTSLPVSYSVSSCSASSDVADPLCCSSVWWRFWKTPIIPVLHVVPVCRCSCTVWTRTMVQTINHCCKYNTKLKSGTESLDL